MKGVFSATVTVLASLILPTAVQAEVINGNFENGLANWQTLGDSKVENSTFGSGTVEGNFQAFLSTAFNEVLGVDGNGREIRGGNAAPVAFISGIAEDTSLEGFLGISDFFGDDTLGNAIEGTAIKQTFAGRAGQTLSFAWNFLTDELVGENAIADVNDFAFATLNFNSQSLFFRLADTTSAFLNRDSRTPFFQETGFKTFSFALPTDGEYTLGLGVVDVGEPTVISGLLVDRVQAVPEGNLMWGLLGLVGICGLKRRWDKYPMTKVAATKVNTNSL